MNLNDYYDLLAATDWTYEMSDDSRAYNHGRMAMDEVMKIAERSAEHHALYVAWREYIWSGAVVPRPKRPFVSGLSDMKAGA